MKLNKEQFFSKLKKGEVKNFIYNGVKYFADSVIFKYAGKSITKTPEYTGKKLIDYDFSDIKVTNPKEIQEKDFIYSAIGFIIRVIKEDKNDKLLKANLKNKDINLTLAQTKGSVIELYIKTDTEKFSYYRLSNNNIKGNYKKSVDFVKKLDKSVIIYNFIEE